MQGHCNVNPIFCLLGDFVLLLISSLYVVGMGDDGTRIQKKRTASRRQLSSTKKGKNGGGVDLSQVAKFAIWDWGWGGVGMSQVANGARFVI